MKTSVAALCFATACAFAQQPEDDRLRTWRESLEQHGGERVAKIVMAWPEADQAKFREQGVLMTQESFKQIFSP